MSTAANTIGAPSGNSASAGQTPLPVKTNIVSVSLRVNVGVSGDVEIFTTSGQAVNNVVECAGHVTVDSLYDSSQNAVFEFWEPSSDPGTITGCVSRADRMAVPGQTGGLSKLNTPGTLLDNLNTSLAAVINSAMDASNAAPFDKYNGSTDYTNFNNFGELALAAHAYYLFGHPAATAAIDNDIALRNYFNTNDTTLPSTSANIAHLLRLAVMAISDTDAEGIVRQVISQDPSRAAGQDNNQLTPDVHQGLLFAADDVIYVSVTLNEPSISQGSPSTPGPATQMPGGAKFPAGGAQYTLRITLSA
jgi:hypothetical protein